MQNLTNPRGGGVNWTTPVLSDTEAGMDIPSVQTNGAKFVYEKINITYSLDLCIFIHHPKLISSSADGLLC